MSFASIPFQVPCLKKHVTHINTHAKPSIPNFNLLNHSTIINTPKKLTLNHKKITKKRNVSSVFFSTTYTATKPSNPAMSAALRCCPISTTRIHIMALDGIVNVNSLFSFAPFVGLTFYPANDPADMLIGSNTACAAGTSSAEGLIAFHVYSFSSFLFSSLVALALKQAIKISRDIGEDNGDGSSVSHIGHVNRVALRVGTLVSAFGSVSGCGFLVMALVDLVQIKLGRLGCGSLYTLAAIGPLVTLVPLALVIYVFLVLHAFTR